MKNPLSVKAVKTRLDAEVIKGFLSSNNIECFISADDEGGMTPFPFRISSTGVQIFVDKKDYEQAIKLLKEKDLL